MFLINCPVRFIHFIGIVYNLSQQKLNDYRPKTLQSSQCEMPTRAFNSNIAPFPNHVCLTFYHTAQRTHTLSCLSTKRTELIITQPTCPSGEIWRWIIKEDFFFLHEKAEDQGLHDETTRIKWTQIKLTHYLEMERNHFWLICYWLLQKLREFASKALAQKNLLRDVKLEHWRRKWSRRKPMQSSPLLMN